MSAAKWIPSDDELDNLARTITPPVLGTDEAEQHRTSLLASAASTPQHRPSSRAPWFALAGALAAAAAILLWVTFRTSPAVPTANVVALGDAAFSREQGWPTYTVRVDDGRVSIDVATVDDSQRFLARTADSEIETRRATLVVGVVKGRVDAVEVATGRAELRRTGEPPIFLGAGESWHATRVAENVETIVPVAPSEPVTPVAPVAPVADPAPAPPPVHAPKHTKAPPVERTAPPESPPVTTAPVEAGPNPGELEFRAAMAALRSGDAAAATTSFASACKAARGDALAEDACFWVGAAANRAGQSSTARSALADFIQRFPNSARTGEASALLGWLLYEANDLDGANVRFERAASDRVPKVRASAEKGLEAIQRRRSSP